MRKLDRNAVAAPPCLSRYKHGQDNWNKVSGADKEAIRERLKQMQGQRCAYCEGPLEKLGDHIEHFWPKGRFPTRTFDWNNLYWSCTQNDSCGVHKDGDAENYHPGDLLDPCSHDPDRFFKYRPYGTIDVRDDIPEADRARAQKTLRIFNLDPGHGRLRSMRKQAADDYLSTTPNILEDLMLFEEDERSSIIKEELAKVADEPFSIVIRHLLLDLV